MTGRGKPILVATDLSARSDRAVDRATMLAGQWGVRLLVLHALEPGSRLESNPELAVDLIRDVLPDPKADVDIISVTGPAPSLIVERAASAGCGLIVTGVGRFIHVGDCFIGTAVDHVVRCARVPVLVVKRRPHRRYSTIMVATDYSSCSKAALLAVAGMFQDAAIHLVHAYHVPYEGWLRSEEVKEDVTKSARVELEAFLQDQTIPDDVRVRVSTHLCHGEPHTVIGNMADELGADLVVLGTHGRGGFLPALVGSVAEALLRYVSRDTLMVREWT